MGKDNKNWSNKKPNYKKKPKNKSQKSWDDISDIPSNLKSMDDKLKHVFAAYLNLAQHNAFVNLNHIAKKMGITKHGNELHLSKHPVLEKLGDFSLKNGKQIENYKLADADYAMRLLFTQFPFLKVIVEWKRKTKLGKNDDKDIANKLDIDEIMSKLSITAQPYMLQEILTDMFEVLNYHRNHHTHYKHSQETLDPKTEKRVAEMCNFALMALCRLVRTRFEINPKDNPSNEAINFLYLKAGDLNFMTQGQYKFDPNKKIAEINQRFFYAMVKDGHLTSMGLVLLICMFLPRNYIMMFIDKLGKDFYGKFWSEDPNQDNKDKQKHRRIMREIFGYFNLPLIKDRYRSEREDTALALDMLNELKKCPKDLYDHLSPEDQASFKIDITTGLSIDSADTVLKRHTNRFPYFALRYIDEREIFSFLRFHVNYGKYRFMLYDNKECVDGSVQPRVLQYDLNGFGRLSEVENFRLEKQDKWLGENVKMLTVSSNNDSADDTVNDELPPDSPDILPYVTNCGTHYQFFRDKIGLRFVGVEIGKNNSVIATEKPEPLMPKVDEYKNKAEAKAEAHLNKTVGDPINVGVTADCRISTYELPAMAIHAWLTRAEKTELINGNSKILVSPTEKIIWDCINNYKKLFTKLSKGKLPRYTEDSKIPESVEGVKWKDIPQKIRDFMCSDNVEDGDETFDNDLFLEYARNLLTGNSDNKKSVIGLRDRTQHILEKFLEDFKAVTGYQFSTTKCKIINKDKSVKKNQVGRRSFTEIKPGRLSTFLARDIVALQSALPADKPTGLNYNIMQKAIAQYGGENGMTLDELKLMFDKLNLVSSHPFLKDVLNAKPSNALVFYYRYLISKIRYIDKLIQYANARNCDELQKVPFLHANQRRFHSRNRAYYEKLANEYIGRPIELPTGLFTDAIIAELAKIDKLKKVVENTRINAAWLIKQYHQSVLDDAVQPMYRFKRNYKLFDTLWPHTELNGDELIVKKHYITPNLTEIDNGDKKISSTLNDIRKNKLKSKKFTEDQRIALRKEFKIFDDRERRFRRYQVEDIVTFLMAKDILTADYTSRDSKNKEIDHNHQLEKINNFKLSELRVHTQKSEDNIIDLEVPFSVTISIDDVKVIISQKAMKVKNYGDFFRFVNDTRIVNLLPYLNQEKDNYGNPVIKIKREDLEKELLAYDLNRTEIYKTVHETERLILNKFKEIENLYYTTEKIDGELKYDFHKDAIGKHVSDNFGAIVSYFDKEVSSIVSAKQASNIMVEIRNAFGHNRYTESDKVSLNAQLTYIAKRIKNIMKESKNSKFNNKPAKPQ